MSALSELGNLAGKAATGDQAKVLALEFRLMRLCRRACENKGARVVRENGVIAIYTRDDDGVRKWDVRSMGVALNMATAAWRASLSGLGETKFFSRSKSYPMSALAKRYGKDVGTCAFALFEQITKEAATGRPEMGPVAPPPDASMSGLGQFENTADHQQWWYANVFLPWYYQRLSAPGQTQNPYNGWGYGAMTPQQCVQGGNMWDSFTQQCTTFGGQPVSNQPVVYDPYQYGYSYGSGYGTMTPQQCVQGGNMWDSFTQACSTFGGQPVSGGTQYGQTQYNPYGSQYGTQYQCGRAVPSVVGQSEGVALAQLKKYGFPARTIQRENRVFKTTADYSQCRANLTVQGGVVVGVTWG